MRLLLACCFLILASPPLASAEPKVGKLILEILTPQPVAPGTDFTLSIRSPDGQERADKISVSPYFNEAGIFSELFATPAPVAKKYSCQQIPCELKIRVPDDAAIGTAELDVENGDENADVVPVFIDTTLSVRSVDFRRDDGSQLTGTLQLGPAGNETDVLAFAVFEDGVTRALLSPNISALEVDPAFLDAEIVVDTFRLKAKRVGVTKVRFTFRGVTLEQAAHITRPKGFDVNDDGKVDPDDLQILRIMTSANRSTAVISDTAPFDFNHDGYLDSSDVFLLSDECGAPCAGFGTRGRASHAAAGGRKEFYPLAEFLSARFVDSATVELLIAYLGKPHLSGPLDTLTQLLTHGRWNVSAAIGKEAVLSDTHDVRTDVLKAWMFYARRLPVEERDAAVASLFRKIPTEEDSLLHDVPRLIVSEFITPETGTSTRSEGNSLVALARELLASPDEPKVRRGCALAKALFEPRPDVLQLVAARAAREKPGALRDHLFYALTFAPKEVGSIRREAFLNAVEAATDDEEFKRRFRELEYETLYASDDDEPSEAEKRSQWSTFVLAQMRKRNSAELSAFLGDDLFEISLAEQTRRKTYRQISDGPPFHEFVTTLPADTPESGLRAAWDKWLANEVTRKFSEDFRLGSLRKLKSDGMTVPEMVPILQRTAEESGGGSLGCGMGTMSVSTPSGIVSYESGLDELHVFGADVEIADLNLILQLRGEVTGKESTGSSRPSGYLLSLTMSTVAEAHDPSSIAPLSTLLKDEDPDVAGQAAGALLKMAETDSLAPKIQALHFPPGVLEQWRSYSSARGLPADLPGWIEPPRPGK